MDFISSTCNAIRTHSYILNVLKVRSSKGLPYNPRTAHILGNPPLGNSELRIFLVQSKPLKRYNWHTSGFCIQDCGARVVFPFHPESNRYQIDSISEHTTSGLPIPDAPDAKNTSRFMSIIARNLMAN